jgi:tripartite-type tricarboxylate transporter receptor subunit TctC
MIPARPVQAAWGKNPKKARGNASMKTIREAIAAGLILAAALGAPAAQADWPEREVTLVVNYGAGGVTDSTVRALAVEAEKNLKVPVQIVNRPGGQGTVGPTFLAAQKPDGYTIGVTSFAPMAISPHMMNVSYSLDDFAFIGGYGRFRYGVAVRTESPIKSIDELVAAAKTRRVTFSASGPPNNLALWNLASKTGVQFQYVPFPSGAEAVTAVLGGHVDAVVQTPTEMLQLIDAGKLRLLASASPVRWTEKPDVPTLIDLGHGISIDSWIGLAAPKGTPPDRLQALEAAFSKSVQSPEVEKAFTNMGMSAAVMTGAEYRAFLDKGLKEMETALAESGLAKKK